jgi:benzylsuccinate CoA-transferase BbsF subunit
VAKGILEGIRIVEFGWAVVGPLTCSWAGNYGAEVIKVETGTRPDHLRTMNPFKGDQQHIDSSVYFSRENASKLSISINLKKPNGVSIAKRLIAKSDVILDSYTSGVMEKYGLGYEKLRKLKNNLIMISSCLFGQTGDLRSMPGYGVTLTAMSGLTYLCGWPDRMPNGPYGSYTDYLVPRFNLLCIVSALDYRRRTGKGLYIDASQLEAAVQFIAPTLLDYDVNKRIAGRCGNSSPDAALHHVFRCKGKERWCAICVFNDEEWSGFTKALGDPPWTKDNKFSTFTKRKKNEQELNQLVEEWTRERSAEDVMHLMQHYGVPAGVVNNGEDLDRDPQLKHSKYYSKRHHPVMGEVKYAQHSIDLPKFPQNIWRSPCLGEHTAYVCKEIIGMNDMEYNEHIKAGDLE